jgi:branched-chain amino acid transport system substrate-binding protein
MKLKTIIPLTLLLLIFSVSATLAQEGEGETPPPEVNLPDEIVCALDIIVQRDDWLSKLSEKFYGDVLAYPAIFEATNAKFAEDNSYAFIEDEDLIEPGWKLCIVGVGVAEQILGFTLEDAPLSDDTPVNLDGPIPVGAAHALSGPLAEVGQSIRNGAELAAQEINNGAFLGRGALEIIWEDTAGDRDKAVAAFNKLINDDQVVAILGPTLSRSAFAAAPLAQAAGVPVIASSNTAAGLTNIGDAIFHTNLPEPLIIANVVEQVKPQKVVLIYDKEDAFTQASHRAFEQALQARNIEVAATFAIAAGETDFSTQLSEIQALQPDTVILNTLSDESAHIILQARQAGLDSQFMGGSAFNSAKFLGLGGQALNGTISGAAWNINSTAGNNRAFVTNYEAEYGSPPDQFAAQAYTAVWALATALRNVDSTDRAAIRSALQELGRIETPLGLFTFDNNHHPVHSPVVQVVENGAFVIFP